VAIYHEGRRQTQAEAKLTSEAKDLFVSGKALKLSAVKEQLKRTTCELALQSPAKVKRTPRDLCLAGRNSHLRVGWSFLCPKCDDWHINLAGGYVLTADGAVGTCYHVAQPGREVKDGCLVAADDEGHLYPVTEILAANRFTDACILRVAAQGLKPLALNTNVYPGDAAYCFSDPLDHRGYFSQGIVNRFYQVPGRRRFSAPASATFTPVRLNVSTDWAPGSSGSAVLDECGNVIGHVSTISSFADEEGGDTPEEPVVTGPTMIIFHEAVSAHDILALVKAGKAAETAQKPQSK
jgi:hypothetical protein